MLRKVNIKGINIRISPIGFNIIKEITELKISKGFMKKSANTKKSKITKPKIRKKKSAFIETKRITRISRKIRELKKSMVFTYLVIVRIQVSAISY